LLAHGVWPCATVVYTPDAESSKQRWVGTPGMNSITKHLAKLPGVTLLLSRRVTGFEVGPGRLSLTTVCPELPGVRSIRVECLHVRWYTGTH
jgi:predicted NAD/FAD-dependent oxidoreductase